MPPPPSREGWALPHLKTLKELTNPTGLPNKLMVRLREMGLLTD